MFRPCLVTFIDGSTLNTRLLTEATFEYEFKTDGIVQRIPRTFILCITFLDSF